MCVKIVDRALHDKGFLERLQKAFEPEDLTESRISEYLYHGESGKHKVKWGKDDKGEQRYREIEGKPISTKTTKIAQELSKVSDYYKKIDKIVSISRLNALKEKVKELPVHSDTLLDNIELKIKERKIAQTIYKTEKFAKEKNVQLSEKTYGNIYDNWGRYHKKAVVIFSKGKIKTWKYIK